MVHVAVTTKDSSDGDGYAICDGLLLFTDHDHLQNQ